MANSIPDLISDDFVTSINGATIEINGKSQVITCERERLINTIGNRYPYVFISGPIIEKENRSHRTYHLKLMYQIVFIDNTVNDEYLEDEAVTPVSKMYGNVISDINSLVMSERQRGGNAQDTDFAGAGQSIDIEDGIPEYSCYLNYIVTSVLVDTDFYKTGG